MLIHIRLVELGYGSYAEVKELNARVVLQAIHYQRFKAKYESAFVEMNK